MTSAATRLIATAVATVLVVLLIASFCENCGAEARTFLRELVRYLR
jgi:hypothetical protein